MASSAADDQNWIKIQKKTFTKWMNNHLAKKGFPVIADLETDFEDGNSLINLVHALYDTKIPTQRKYGLKQRVQKIDNINLGLAMLETAEVKTNFLKNTHLIDHDLKMLLGMVWAIILDYAIKGISVEQLSAKEGLLLWVQKKTKGYKDVDPPGVKNFKGDWKSGLPFCALIHRHRPDLLDYDSLDPKNAEQNLELAFKIAEEKLNIPRLMDLEDFKGTPDERAVMTQVSEYFHRFASQDEKEIAAKRIANFANFARQMAAKQSEYERRAAAFIAWCRQQSQNFENRDFGNSIQEAMGASDNFKNFIISQRPVQEGEKIDIENLFADIQSQLKVNGRRPYVPPAGVTPDDMEQASDNLTATQKQYAAAVRANRLRFVKKAETKVSDEKIAEIKEAFKHFDHNKNNTLDKLEFKAALSAMSIFVKDDSEFGETFNRVSEGKGHITLEGFTNFLIAKYQDRDSVDQIKDSFRQVADGGAVITAAQLQTPPISAEDAAYLSSSMPASGGGFDYAAFVDANFTSE